MMWSMAAYRRGDLTGIAILHPDGTLVAPPDLKRWATMLELLDDWEQAQGVLRSLEIADAPAVSYDALLAPVRFPRNARGLYLRPGDVVATAIDGLGRLNNPVIDSLGGNP